MVDQHQADADGAVLYSLARSRGVQPFRDDVDRLFVTIGVDGHDETHALNSRPVRSWLQRIYYKAIGRLPNRDVLGEVMEKLEAAARFEGPEHQVFVRIAAHDGCIYLDVGNPTWQAIEITFAGWHVINKPPVKFRRPRGLLPLPLPIAGGSVNELRPFLNVERDDDFTLLIAALLGALRGRGPFPIVGLIGEQGSAKSTATRVLGRLIDPNACELRGEPHDLRDLMIAANNGYLLRYDNVSHIPPWRSDALCRLLTGIAFTTRELYSDDQEVLINAQRPVILNSITDVLVRPDLLDRAILIRLPDLPDTRRRPEVDFWADFEQAQPRILGALLDAAVVALRDESSTQLKVLPRMADFARWVVAAESALPWPAGDFLRAYSANRRGAVVAMLDDDPVADAVRALVTPSAWLGTAAELLAALQRAGAVRLTDPRQATGALRRLAPALRQAGVEVNFAAGTKHGGRKLLHLYKRAGATP